jgi:hypothetical protein
MSCRLSVSTGALIVALMMSITAGQAWGEPQGHCIANESDHGSGCLPTTESYKCQDGGWQPLELLENLFTNHLLCI